MSGRSAVLGIAIALTASIWFIGRPDPAKDAAVLEPNNGSTSTVDRLQSVQARSIPDAQLNPENADPENAEEGSGMRESTLRSATTFKDLPLKEQEYSEHQAVSRAKLSADSLINGVQARENDQVLFDEETGAAAELELRGKAQVGAQAPLAISDASITGTVLFHPEGGIYQARLAEEHTIADQLIPAETLLNFDRDGKLAEITPEHDFEYRGKTLKAGAVYQFDANGNALEAAAMGN